MQHRYKTISADRFTPVIVFKKLRGLALLESAVLEGANRYSFIVLSAESQLSLTKDGVVESKNGQDTLLTKDPQQFLDSVLSRGKTINADDLPFPLPARGVGYLGYEFCRFCDKINLPEKPAAIDLPDAAFIFGSAFVVFDHYRDDLHIVVFGEDIKTIEQQIDAYINRLEDNDFTAYTRDKTVYPAKGDLQAHKAEFLRGVEEIKKAIVRGDLIQGVISQQIIVSSELPAFEAYCRLRRENPSPYLFYLDFQDFQIFGASPEIMVQTSGETVTIKPIAGTRPRGKTPAEDLALEKELLSDEKERAEHLMLIDLARNDVGRIAVPGSVQVPKSFFIERYTYVMHIVSEVCAKIRPELSIADIIRSSFPAGTVSGAPKIKAIELVAEQEPVKRGPYAGLIGYFDVHGSFDSCITIRSVLHKDDKFIVQSGAGIVYDSVPEKEFTETLNKAMATIKSLEVSL
ncbi:anthranilate synthases component I [Candidatus Termititenax dinenymphae]|uniref:Anthranilate synthase component 1 n=1 Tax=Candidatus Termititenax dinenymphae TaxID=2218523 RepID=A0A388TLV0_9BACT|nr:anthranilate synthases component I [Candidatus Termititenax dinenymphae]